MTLTIDGQEFTNVLISNGEELINNQYINRFRTLNGSLITQIIGEVNKVTEILELSFITKAQYDFLRERNGTDIPCSLSGASGHDFSGTYNLELPDNLSKSYNETRKFNITLHKI